MGGREIALGEGQRRVLALCESGANVFFTGVGGTGKTTLLLRIADRLREKYGRNAVAVTAPTGMAAILCKGQTLHSLGGCGVPITVADFGKCWGGRDKGRRWKQLRAIIIDEVSMVDPSYLDWLDATVRVIRRRPDQPFGGVQLILAGDMCQLPGFNTGVSLRDPCPPAARLLPHGGRIPPAAGRILAPPASAAAAGGGPPPKGIGAMLPLAGRGPAGGRGQGEGGGKEAVAAGVGLADLEKGYEGEVYGKRIPTAVRECGTAMVFQSVCWREAGLVPYELTEVFRQREAHMVSALCKLRRGVLDHEVFSFVRSCERPLAGGSVVPTVLYARNADVDAENAGKMAQLTTDVWEYESWDWVDVNEEEVKEEHWDKVREELETSPFWTQCISPRSVVLKVGAQVMLTRNLDYPEEVGPEHRLVNGSRGVIVDFVPAPPKDPTGKPIPQPAAAAGGKSNGAQAAAGGGDATGGGIGQSHLNCPSREGGGGGETGWGGNGGDDRNYPSYQDGASGGCGGACSGRPASGGRNLVRLSLGKCREKQSRLPPAATAESFTKKEDRRFPLVEFCSGERRVIEPVTYEASVFLTGKCCREQVVH